MLMVAMLGGCGAATAARQATTAPTIIPAQRPGVGGRIAGALHLRREKPTMEWGEDRDEWTEAMLQALDSEGVTLLSSMPADVMQYCPGYASQTRENRAAFWAGFLSSVARQQSGLNPQATGRGGLMGLMQISSRNAQENSCGGSMLDGSDNLKCAVRIMARRVASDNAIHGGEDAPRRGWRGAARDWISLRSPGRRAAVAAFTSRQSYCR